jgi:hypothetical protein
MDTTAHRIIKHARDMLVDDLGGCQIVSRDATWPEIAAAMGHGFNAEQAQALVDVTNRLWNLMMDDPAPPDCQNCCTPLTQARTGRPRRFCSDACRSADARARSRPGCAHALDARNCAEPGGGCPDARDALR